MSRNSKFSSKNYLAATSLRPNTPSRDLSLADQLIETRPRSEQAKLALLKADLPKENDKKYTRYVDMPPPTPEDEAQFEAEFQQIMREIFDSRKEEEDCEEEGPEDGQSVQDWLRGRGATLPHTPEWEVPLYLERYKRRSGI